MSYTIRQANEYDAKSLIELQIALQYFCYNLAIKHGASKEEARIHLPKRGAYKVKKYAKWLKNLNKEKKQMVYLAVDDSTNKVVGFISAEIKTMKDLIIPKSGYVTDLFIYDEHRGKGCASMLIKAVLQWFKSMRVKHVSLDVDINNSNAIKLYSKIGFKKSMYKMYVYLTR